MVDECSCWIELADCWIELAWLSVRADRSALPVAISCAAVRTSELACLTSWMMPRSESVKSLNARAIWPT